MHYTAANDLNVQSSTTGGQESQIFEDNYLTQRGYILIDYVLFELILSLDGLLGTDFSSEKSPHVLTVITCANLAAVSSLMCSCDLMIRDDIISSFETL